MSHYAFSLERAREAATMVSTLEDRLSRNPGDFALRVSLASAVRMAEQMERELYEVAAVEQVDICRYRLVRHTGPGFALQGVSQSLAAFQDAVSYVLDAITGKPRQRAGLSRDIMRESELLFGWSFAGSLGVVLLAPSERRLFDTRFDDVVRTLTEAFDTDDNDELRDVARKSARQFIHVRIASELDAGVHGESVALAPYGINKVP